MAFTIADFLARSGAQQSTLDYYEDTYRRLERAIGTPLADASQRAIERLKKRLRAQRSGPQTANVLRMFYRAAAKAARTEVERRRYESIMETLQLRQRVRRLSPNEVLDVLEVNRLLGAARSLRDRALIAVLWESGARIHEVCALDVADLREFESKENGGRTFLTLFFRKVKVSGEEHSTLLIESADHVRAWVRAYAPSREDLPLFPSSAGSRLTTSGARYMIEQATKRAALKKRVYPHLFRHSRATHLLQIGVPEAQVKRLLGWTAGSTMLARYSHLVSRDAYAALLRAHGYEPPEPTKAGLAPPEGELRPVLTMPSRPLTIQERLAREDDELVKRLWLAALEDPSIVERIRAVVRGRIPPPPTD